MTQWTFSNKLYKALKLKNWKRKLGWFWLRQSQIQNFKPLRKTANYVVYYLVCAWHIMNTGGCIFKNSVPSTSGHWTGWCIKNSICLHTKVFTPWSVVKIGNRASCYDQLVHTHLLCMSHNLVKESWTALFRRFASVFKNIFVLQN